MRTLTITTLLALLTAPLVAQPATVTGTVLGPDGEPVAGATVGTVTQFEPPFAWENTTSAEDGSFAFTLTTPRRGAMAVVAAFAEGLGVVGKMTTTPGTPIELQFSDELGSLSGTVSDADAQAIEGARVSVMGLRRPGDNQEMGGWFIDWDHAPAAETDADGGFVIEDLPAGMQAALSVEADGYATWRDIMPERWRVVGEDAEIEIALERGGVIAGRVIHDGDPVEGATLRAVGRLDESVSWGQAVTDADGRYEVGGISPGTFQVSVQPMGALVAPPAEEVQVEAGVRIDDVDFELLTGSIVRGRVTWKDTGDPVPDTTIYAGAGGELGGVSVAETDADGFYQLRVPPGEHRVMWTGPRVETRGAEPAQGYEITIAADEAREGFDFVLSRKPTIEITVLGPDGAPAVGADVLWGGTGRPDVEPVTTDDNGRVEVLYGAPVSDYNVSQVGALAQDTDAGLAGMTIIDGEAETEATIRLGEGAWAEVSAQTPDGEPVAGAQFQVRYRVGDTARDFLLPATTDEQGKLRIGPLPANVELGINPSYDYARRTITPRDQGMPSTVFAPGETREFGPYIMAIDGLTVRGTVIDEDGDPVAGALVFGGDSISHEPVEDETDADGRFELTGLAVAQEVLTLIAAMPDGSAAWAEPVDPQVAYEPTIQLGKPGTIVATIVGADGRPVPDVEAQISGENVRVSRPQSLPGGLKTYSQSLSTDAEGQVRVENLVPGVNYHLSWRIDPEANEWRAGDSIPIYGDGAVVEVTRNFGG